MTEQVLTTDEGNYIIMTVYEIVERLRAERDECHETNKRLRAERGQLLAALRGALAAYDADWSKHGGDYETGITRAMRDARAAVAAVEKEP